jgi:hypothetical protein
VRRFCFGLASELGCTVAELLDRISSAELTEWMAWYRVEEEDRAEAEKREQGRRRDGG